jgi:hypothetical protein
MLFSRSSKSRVNAHKLTPSNLKNSLTENRKSDGCGRRSTRMLWLAVCARVLPSVIGSIGWLAAVRLFVSIVTRLTLVFHRWR